MFAFATFDHFVQIEGVNLLNVIPEFGTKDLIMWSLVLVTKLVTAT
jgi:hypothetical protein